MLADIERTCINCTSRFWWLVEDQLADESNQLPPPTLCRRCRASQNALVPSRQSSALERADRAFGGGGALAIKADLPAPLGDDDPILRRIQELVVYAASNYVPRTQTFLEWLRQQDPNQAEVQARQWSGQHAHNLMAARHELLRLVRDQDDTMLHRVEMHVAARLAVMRADVEAQRLAAESESITLQRQTALLEAAVRHKALLDGPTHSAPADPLRQEAAEHRHRLQVEAEAAQDIYSDFLFTVQELCARRLPLNEKAVRIRRVMDAFEMGEESLPDHARRLLRATERLSDED